MVEHHEMDFVRVDEVLQAGNDRGDHALGAAGPQRIDHEGDAQPPRDRFARYA